MDLRDFMRLYILGVSRFVLRYPVRCAFVLSLFLSLVAFMGVVVVNKDAALYLDVAHSVSNQGVSVAIEQFNWPWFVFLLSGSYWLTGWPIEVIAYAWCALFMAGTCALMVDTVRRKVPDATGWAFLIVLAMPAFNQFRNDILREFGFWFFSILSIWLAMRWWDRPGYIRALPIHASVIVAALFRLEAVFLLFAMVLWQLPGLMTSEGRKRVLQLWTILALLVSVAAISVIMQGSLSSERVAYYLELISPVRVVEAFKELSGKFANSLSKDYSKDEAGQIVFFGIVAVIIVQFLKLCGPFVVPVLYKRSWRAFQVSAQRFPLFFYAAGGYFLILLLFFVNEHFVNSRYMSFLNLLAVPVLAVAAMLFIERFPRLRGYLVAAALLVMLGNVVSFSAKKTHYVEAAHWVAENIENDARVYYEDSRLAYYAGRGYPSMPRSRQEAMSENHPGDYSYFLIEADGDEPWLMEWLASREKYILASFSNRKGARVLIIGD